MLGCALISIEAPGTDLRSPYASQSDDAFNGRTLDQEVVNPILQQKRIPSTKNAYLAMFRRSVGFTAATRNGVRDKKAYDGLLQLIGYIDTCSQDERSAFLLKLLCRLVELREKSDIRLLRLNRIGATQYRELISGLLKVPSQGRLPVMIVVSILYAVKAHYSLTWTIEFQGINQSDAARGAYGDVTIKDGERVVLAAEITERKVDKPRLVATFNSKISPDGLKDYVFFVKLPSPTEEAYEQAAQYFAQGSEVNFVDILTWSWVSLVTIGQTGRDAFNAQLTLMLTADDVPRSVKVSWNDLVAKITSI